jgi:hypothetical protein
VASTTKRVTAVLAVAGVIAAAWWWLGRADAPPTPEAGFERAAVSSPPQPTATAGLRGAARPVAEVVEPPVEATFPVAVKGPVESVALRIFVDGRPALPARYTIRAGRDAFVLMPGLTRSGPVEEDRDRAEVRFRMPVPAEAGDDDLHVWFHAEDAWPSGTVPRRRGPAEWVGEVHVESAGRVVADVVGGDPRELTVVVLSPETGRWEVAPTPPGYKMLFGKTADGVTTYGPLREGRYALVDRESGLMSDTVDVKAAGAPPTARLDLSRAGFVTGRVVVPETKILGPVELSAIRVWVEGDGIFHTHPTPVGPDGAFAVKVPGDRPVTLRPAHAILVPDEAEGPVVVHGPRDGVRLLMEIRTLASLRPVPSPVTRPWLPPLRVLRYAGEPTGEPVQEHAVDFRDGVVRFGGYPPGRWTFVFDAHGHAPKTLAAVEAPVGAMDLGEVRLDRGSGVRVRVLWNEGGQPPPVIVQASRRDVPRYHRVVEATPDPFVTLTGLGPGRFSVTTLDKGARRREEAELEVDGTSDVDMTLDLR